MRSSRPLFVSFSGIDGAGKSTQIANLRTHLEAAGLQVQLITFWDDVATLTRLREGAGHAIFKGDKGVGTPEEPIERRDKNVRSSPMTVVRLVLYFLDALSLCRVSAKARRCEQDVIIFDRYLFDELANLNLDRALMRGYARFLSRLVPRPQAALVLDTDPVAAHARKPEYPLDFLHVNRQAYLDLARVLGGVTVIPPLPLAHAKLAVVAAVDRVRTQHEGTTGSVAFTS